MNFIEKYFPSFGISNIRLYYLIIFFSNSWFIIGSWLFFAFEYVTPTQMGIIEAVSFFMALSLEIPSGAIADLLGKKRTTALGLFLHATGLLIFMLAFLNPWFLVIGNIMTISAFAFISGSLEALAYDSMVEVGKETHYDTVASRAGLLYPVSLLFASSIGGVLWKISHFAPFIFNIIFVFIALAISFKLREPSVDTYHFSWKQFARQHIEGFRELFKPVMRHYIPIFIVILGTYSMWDSGIVRLQMGSEFGFDGETLSYLIGGVSFISSLVVYQFDAIKKRLGNAWGLSILSFIACIGWLLATQFSGVVLGIVTFSFLAITGQLLGVWRSSILNKLIDSKLRATAISTVQFFIQIPYVIAILVYGTLIENNTTEVFYLLTAGLIIFSLITSFLLKKFVR